MKHLTVESFVNSLPEEEIWKIIEDYETYGAGFEARFEAQFLREKALEYCDTFCYREAYAEYMPEIVLFAYRHFALKYKESMKCDEV
jgi:hypothetical protein